MKTLNTLLYSNTSVTGSFTTNAVNTEKMTFLAFQLNTTGTLIGTFYVELSNDGTNWFRISSADQSLTAGSNLLTEMVDVCALYARAGVTVSSGTGTTVSVYAVAKGPH